MRYLMVANEGHTDVQPLMAGVIRHGAPEGSKIIHHARNTLYVTRFKGTDINIKDFKLPNAVNRYVYGRLRKSKAERSYLHAVRLLRLGFLTPEPYGFAEQYEGVSLRRSCYFSAQITGEEMRDIDSKPDGEALLRALGAEMVRLHRAGVFMKDFSPGNVLFVRRDDGGYDFYYVDLNRIEFNVHNYAKLMRMFRCMVYTPEHVRILADGYCDAMGYSGTKREVVHLAAQEELHRYIEQSGRKSYLKKIMKSISR